MIYNNILEIAKKKGISIAELERKAGLGKATISKWKKASPTVDKLLAVSKVLKVNINKLLEERSNHENGSDT